MSTPTEEGLNAEPLNVEERLADIEKRAEALTEEVDPKVLADQPQPEPPQPEPKKSRFTIICVCKVVLDGAPDPEVRDVAAVHVMGTSIADAKQNAKLLLAAHIKQTTLDDWDAVLAYLGHQEILNG